MFSQGVSEPLSILVVDDEPAVRDALKIVLESRGYEVVSVESGREGLEQVMGGSFGLAIIDLYLADTSGLRVIKTIRDQQCQLQVILMTGQGSPRAFSEATRLGVVGVLIKPFPPDDVLEMITRLVTT